MNSEGIYTGTEHLTPGLIREYLDGKLSKAKMHEIELHLLECDFCTDAVEGFELSEKSHIKTERTLLALRKRLNERLRQHEQPRIMRWPAWSAAAGIALAIAAYVVIRQQENEQEQLAILQSEAFLQTDSNDTLLIFMPAEPELAAREELLASNGPEADEPEVLRQSAETPDGDPAAAIARRPSEVRERPSFHLPDSPDTENAVAAVNRDTASDEVVIVEKKRALTGQVSLSPGKAVPKAGRAAYASYLANSLRYPTKALDKKIEGEVTVRFTVQANGSLADFRVLDSLGYGCDEEAIRLIREGPEWTPPAVKDGRRQAAEAIRKVKFELPGKH